MEQDKILPDLIRDIYDTVGDPSLWPVVLEQAAGYVGGRAASVFTKDSSGGGSVLHGFGIDPYYSGLYFKKYGRLDPIAISDAFPEPGVPTAVTDLIPYDQYKQTEFYRAWAEPQGLTDFIGCILDKAAGGTITFLGAPRHEDDGPVDSIARAHMARIAPHVRRAMSLAAVARHDQTETRMFADVLDGLGMGVFLLGRGGNVIHANAAGRALLTQGDVLYVLHDRLAARSTAGDRSLRATLGAVGAADRIADARFTVPLTSQQDNPYVGHILPIGAGGIGAGLDRQAAAVLFVQMARVRPVLPESIARHYGLTPTELRVLLAIVEVGSGPEAADRLGVAESTVKTHLHRLYQKTGTRGQVDLVKLVTGFASPLAG